MIRSAVISPCERYRYRLTRRWGEGSALFLCMLNPSRADAQRDDPTIRRCIKLSQGLGYSAIEVGSLYAYRTSKPAALVAASRELVDIIGPENYAHLRAACQSSAQRVAAWGNPPSIHGPNHWRSIGGAATRGLTHISYVLSILLEDEPLYCFGETRFDAPIHPLARGRHYLPIGRPLAVHLAEWPPQRTREERAP